MRITRHTVYMDGSVIAVIPHSHALQASAPPNLVGSGAFKRQSRTILVLAAVELQVRGIRGWSLELKRSGQDLARSVLR
jgi:hypothetical protein